MSTANEAVGREPNGCVEYREFASRRAGMIHAMDGGLWLRSARMLGEE